VSRRQGDYAICGVAALVELGPDGQLSSARAAFISVGPVPAVLDLTAASTPADGFAEAGRLAMSQLRPGGDLHATADYRRHLAGVLTRRAFTQAYAQARGRGAANGGAANGGAANGRAADD
jgi:carbon-monoxide dehydrogenase medium subunit